MTDLVYQLIVAKESQLWYFWMGKVGAKVAFCFGNVLIVFIIHIHALNWEIKFQLCVCPKHKGGSDPT